MQADSANTDARSFYRWTQWRHKLPLWPEVDELSGEKDDQVIRQDPFFGLCYCREPHLGGGRRSPQFSVPIVNRLLLYWPLRSQRSSQRDSLIHRPKQSHEAVFSFHVEGAGGDESEESSDFLVMQK